MAEINVDEVFNKLKKRHGEKFARVIRGDMDHNGNLCEVPNIVHILEFAGRNPDDAHMLRPIIDKIYNQHEESVYDTDKDPLTLLDEAGYKAWYVENEEQQNSIAGYFRSQRAVDKGMTGGHPRTSIGGLNGELLCTVYKNWDSGEKRFDNWYIIHAVRKEVVGDDKLPESEWHIKPSMDPKRQDPYGTSVISIQIAKSGGAISIKNRYNHTLRRESPDATFGNNPDNIIHGLTNSLKKHFDVEFTAPENELPTDFCIIGDQFVHYNYEIDNVYFGPDFYCVGSDIKTLKNDYQVMLDYMVLDERTGEISNPSGTIETCVPGVLSDEFKNKKIKRKTDKKTRQITIYADGVRIADVIDGKIIKLNLPDVTEIKNDFVVNPALQEINLPNVKKIGDDFLNGNEGLTSIDLPNVVEVGGDFLSDNELLNNVNMPNVIAVGPCFLRRNRELQELSLPKVQEIGYRFMEKNQGLSQISLPEVRRINDYFLHDNLGLTSISLLKVTEVGQSFLRNNMSISDIDLPNLKRVKGGFLGNNTRLKNVNLPNVEEIDKGFLSGNTLLESINLPNVVSIGDDFLQRNLNIGYLDLPKVKTIGDRFLSRNKCLVSIKAPQLESVNNNFLCENTDLSNVDFPELRNIEYGFLKNNHDLRSINLPKATSLGSLSPEQPYLKYFYAPELPDDISTPFQKINLDIAFMIAQQRVHKMIDKQAESAKKKWAAIGNKHQVVNE